MKQHKVLTKKHLSLYFILPIKSISLLLMLPSLHLFITSFSQLSIPLLATIILLDFNLVHRLSTCKLFIYNSHDLAHIFGARGPGVSDDLAHDLPRRGLIELFRQIGTEVVDLGFVLFVNVYNVLL